MSYQWMMKKTEHINNVWEIREELRRGFRPYKNSSRVGGFLQEMYFPLLVPMVFCNLCIGMNLMKRTGHILTEGSGKRDNYQEPHAPDTGRRGNRPGVLLQGA